MPLFEDVLQRFGKQTFMDIEFKTEGFEEQAVALIKRWANLSQVMISGFNTDMLNKVYELCPEVRLDSFTTVRKTRSRGTTARSTW